MSRKNAPDLMQRIVLGKNIISGKEAYFRDFQFMFMDRIHLISTQVCTETEELRAKMEAVSASSATNPKSKKGATKTPIVTTPEPEYIKHRIEMFDRLKQEYDAELAAKPRCPISIHLPDGRSVPGTSFETTPLAIALSIGKSLAENSVISKVNGELWDLERPLESDCSLQLLNFDDPEGQQVFWHSSAHVLGEAMECAYGCWLCYGPPIDEGFYYDAFMHDSQVSSQDFPAMEERCKKILKEKQPFIRLEMKKEDLLKMFEYNPFKVRILNEKVDTPTTTVYRCGPLIDLCRGPHVRHTGKIGALAVTKNSSTYWEGNCSAESLQRIYGISFPQEKQLKEWKHLQEEAAKRDHRKIGKEQELFFFHEYSPGSCFFNPRGAHIYNTLVEFIRSEYRKRGFTEVITPNIYSTKLWETSGHWQHYSENMFSFEVEKERYALKPMNCPGHCLMFAHRTRSWRELPIRFADFGVLHRNELSGALTGLTRVRRFQQDDAHIFCTVDQISTEIASCLDFLLAVYEIFGFSLKLNLSTRPEKFMGDIEVWDRAEKELEGALNNLNRPWHLNPGDGAFYGPKIDIQIQDALRRYHQCATIQLDFQLPERFDLTYASAEGDDKKRPVIIHRAILGSVERMIAILTENYGGKWPFWLSPYQAIVIPVNPAHDPYAVDVQKTIGAAGFMVDINIDAGLTLNKKIRNAEIAHYNFILVVGDKERHSSTVNVRTRDNVVHGEKSLDQLLSRFRDLVTNKKLSSEEAF